MNKHEQIQHNIKTLKVEARGKKKNKKASMRSEMLRMVMPLLSNERGEQLAEAIHNGKISEVSRIMQNISKDLAAKVEVHKHRHTD